MNYFNPPPALAAYNQTGLARCRKPCGPRGRAFVATHKKLATIERIEQLITNLRAVDAARAEHHGKEGNERDEEKLETLKEQFRKMDVRRYVCVAESWLAVASDRDDFREMRPSERPDRREVVFFIAVERGRRLNVMAEIERTNTGRRLKSFHSFDVRGMDGGDAAA